jgi:hypothetical protein
VGCGKEGRIEGFPRGGGPAVKFDTVPGGDPLLTERLSGSLGRLGGAKRRQNERRQAKKDYSFHILLSAKKSGFVRLSWQPVVQEPEFSEIPAGRFSF